MRIHTLTTLVLVGLISGCGEDSAATNTVEPHLSATISGAVTSDYSDRASVYCSATGMGGNELEMYSRGDGGESVNLRMPADIEPGSYPLESGNGGASNDGIHFYYRTAGNPKYDQYDKARSGQIEFQSVPTAKGEDFIGKVDATLADDDSGKTVDIKLQFDFPAGSQSFKEC